MGSESFQRRLDTSSLSALNSQGSDHGGRDSPKPQKNQNSTIYKMKSRILNTFRSGDYNKLRSNIILFPLSFVFPDYEKEYYDRMSYSFGIRAKISAIASFITFAISSIIVSLALSFGKFPSSGFTMSVLLCVVMGLILITSWIPFMASLFDELKDYLETSIYIFVLTTTTAFGTWMLVNVLLETPSGDLNHLVRFRQTKVWLNVFIYTVPFWGLILMDIVMQARTKSSFLVHLANLGISMMANIAQTAVFEQKTNHHTSSRQPQFLIVSTTLDSYFFIGITLLLFVGRWFIEYQDRIEVLRRLGASEQVRRLKELRSEQKKGATAIEDVLSLLERVIGNVKEVSIETNLPSLAEGGELLKECHEILTATGSLYNVQFESKRGEGDDDLLEHQFFQLYTNQQFPRSPTRVRFGEVTGVQYNVLEATSELTKSGRLITSRTLDRSDLLSLHNPTRMQMTAESLISPSLTNQEIVSIGKSWDADILLMSEKYDYILLEVGNALIGHQIQQIQSTPACLCNYIRNLASFYYTNPFHNKVHAAYVAHAAFCLMRMLFIFQADDYSSLTDIIVAIAALGHDIGHPGRTNNFLTNTGDPLALLYNDNVVLENAHSALTFKCLELKGANIFADISPEVFRKMRKRIIELILITDMGQHFETVSRFRLRRQAIDFNYLKDSDDMWFVIRMCLKCADLGHAFSNWPVHFEWSLRVTEEFYEQGDEEKRLGLKISPLCDRQHHHDLAKSQKGFLEFVVEPLLAQMKALEYGHSVEEQCYRHLIQNKSLWELNVKEKTEIPLDEYEDPQTHRHHCLSSIVSLYTEGHTLKEMTTDDTANE